MYHGWLPIATSQLNRPPPGAAGAFFLIDPFAGYLYWGQEEKIRIGTRPFKRKYMYAKCDADLTFSGSRTSFIHVPVWGQTALDMVQPEWYNVVERD